MDVSLSVRVGRIAVACAVAAAAAVTLTGCTYYKGEEYFDPFGVLRAQGGETREENKERELRLQIQADRAKALQAALPGGQCPGAVPGAELVKRDPDPAVVGAMVKECTAGNDSGGRI
jgi:hypothetical protein